MGSYKNGMEPGSHYNIMKRTSRIVLPELRLDIATYNDFFSSSKLLAEYSV
jgi:hypothetical protein